MTDKPDPLYVDSDGVPWWNFLYGYDWEGKSYGFHICARSKEEADARLKRLPLARYCGQAHGAPITANTVTKFYVPLMVRFKNFLRARKPTGDA